METRELDPGVVWELRHAMAGYMADVAELLLADGYPVGWAAVSGATDEADVTALAEPGADGQVMLFFPNDVDERYDGGKGLHNLALGYSGLSGWHICGESTGRRVDRWLGAGLTPAPAAVANFFAVGAFDLESAGSEDRPFYRAPGVELPELVARLRAVASRSFDAMETRIERGRLKTCWNNTVRDVLDAPDDDTVTLTVPAGELRALERLVDFAVDIEGAHEHLRRFARLLVQDWRARAAGSDRQPAGPGSRLAREYVQRHAI